MLKYLSEEEEEDLTTTATNLANKQKKELAKVDHSGVDYPSFRKSFYTEVPELARITPEEVEVYREVLVLSCHCFCSIEKSVSSALSIQSTQIK